MQKQKVEKLVEEWVDKYKKKPSCLMQEVDSRVG